MTKLNQVIAIEKGIKSRVYGEVTELHKAAQKPALFNGFAKNYRKKDEDGEELPAERQRVQFTSKDVLNAVERNLSELMDVTATKDWTNCVAKGDVTVDGKVLVKGAPVSFLLFLEKQLTDMRTFVEKMPVLDEAEEWEFDANSGIFKTDVTSTHRTKKTQKPIVLFPATPEHPAQTQLITEDVIVGFWDTVKHSGALPKPEKAGLSGRIEKLLKAVKEAREAANVEETVKTPSIGSAVFEYLLPK